MHAAPRGTPSAATQLRTPSGETHSQPRPSSRGALWEGQCIAVLRAAALVPPDHSGKQEGMWHLRDAPLTAARDLLSVADGLLAVYIQFCTGQCLPNTFSILFSCSK